MNSAMWLGACLSQRTNWRRSDIVRSRSRSRMNHSAAWSLTDCSRPSSCSFIAISPILHIAEVILLELHAQLAVSAREVAQDHSVGQSLAFCNLFVRQPLVYVQQQDLPLPPGQLVHCLLHVFICHLAGDGVLGFIVESDLQILEPAVFVRLAMARPLLPLVGDVRGDPE